MINNKEEGSQLNNIAISVNCVSKKYGNLFAIDNLSLEI